MAAMERRRSSFKGWAVRAFALVEVLLGNTIVWLLVSAY